MQCFCTQWRINTKIQTSIEIKSLSSLFPQDMDQNVFIQVDFHKTDTRYMLSKLEYNTKIDESSMKCGPV